MLPAHSSEIAMEEFDGEAEARAPGCVVLPGTAEHTDGVSGDWVMEGSRAGDLCLTEQSSSQPASTVIYPQGDMSPD